MNRAAGQSVYDAAINRRTRTRLRPIVMTSLAFILGCVPLAIAAGASANSQISIGTGVIGGMLGATVIAMFFIPMFYWAIEIVSEKMRGKDKAAGNGDARHRCRGRRAAGGAEWDSNCVA